MLTECTLLSLLGGAFTAPMARAADAPLPNLDQLDPVRYKYSEAIVDFA